MYPVEDFTLDSKLLHNQRLWWLWQIWGVRGPTILGQGGEEADFSFCKSLWELSLHQVGTRQNGNELLDYNYDEQNDDEDGDEGDAGDDDDGDNDDDDGNLGEKGWEDQPEELVEEFQFRTTLGDFLVAQYVIYHCHMSFS